MSHLFHLLLITDINILESQTGVFFKVSGNIYPLLQEKKILKFQLCSLAFGDQQLLEDHQQSTVNISSGHLTTLSAAGQTSHQVIPSYIHSATDRGSLSHMRSKGWFGWQMEFQLTIQSDVG